MPKTQKSLRRMSQPILALVVALAALAFPATSPALELEIVNESGKEAWLTPYTANPADYDVPGFTNNEPRALSSITDNKLTIEKLIAGRILVALGDSGVTEPIAFNSQTRFDWIELTLTPAAADVANLTAVEQVGIGMRLNTFGAGDEPMGELASANSETIFSALQEIPGGPESTIRDGEGNILRVLSPLQSSAYPDLGDYVRSMAGKTIHLHSTFSGPGAGEFTTSAYSGTFAANGSILLSGTTEGDTTAPAEILMPGAELIEAIYSGKDTPNTLEGQIRHDVLVGFMAGYWDGRYGNDAIGFCSDPNTAGAQPYCPTGFNQPAFGDARPFLSPFPTCEQYAAVIDQYADMYGNPYSDGASGEVTVPIFETGGKAVETLRLTILPDSGDARPVTGGNSNCGAGSGSGPGSSAGSSAAAPPAPPVASRVGVRARLLKKARLKRGKLRVARVACSAPCGRVRAVLRRGKRVIARAFVKRAGRKSLVVARLTKPGRRLLRHRRKLKARLDLWVAPRGQRATHRRGKLLLIR